MALEAATRKEPLKERTSGVDWAELVRRTFDFDVLGCVRSGGGRGDGEPIALWVMPGPIEDPLAG